MLQQGLFAWILFCVSVWHSSSLHIEQDICGMRIFWEEWIKEKRFPSELLLRFYSLLWEKELYLLWPSWGSIGNGKLEEGKHEKDRNILSFFWNLGNPVELKNIQHVKVLLDFEVYLSKTWQDLCGHCLQGAYRPTGQKRLESV